MKAAALRAIDASENPGVIAVVVLFLWSQCYHILTPRLIAVRDHMTDSGCMLVCADWRIIMTWCRAVVVAAVECFPLVSLGIVAAHW